MRRDLTGTPATRPIRDCAPLDSDHVAAAIHRRLLDRGAVIEPHRYWFSEQSVRVVSGRGRLLSHVRADYRDEPPSLSDVDQVVCAGAIEDPSSPHIVRGGGIGSIVRPGSRASWKTHESIVSLLQDTDDQSS